MLLGASINLKVLVTAAGPAIIQALLLISIVFGFTWWLGGRLGLDDKLRALLASAVSICGVSAAIAAAGAVQAKREQLAYAASLVIAFALPSIFLLPWLSDVFGLSDEVAGAWIGGNIDTTAAVAASGAIAGENALQIATIVKTTQNALIGVVAIALTAYFALKVERRSADEARPTLGQFWERFPKFVLGFIAASIIGTLYLQWVSDGKAEIATVNDLRTWFLIFAFVSIGLEFSLKGLREAGWRPIACSPRRPWSTSSSPSALRSCCSGTSPSVSGYSSISSTGVGRWKPRVTASSHTNPIASQINPTSSVSADRLIHSHTVSAKPMSGRTRLLSTFFSPCRRSSA